MWHRWPTWANGDPNIICPGEWQWSYANVVVCDGCHMTVGDINDPCFNFPSGTQCTVSQQCADECYGGNTTVNVAWANIGGNIIITVY